MWGTPWSQITGTRLSKSLIGQCYDCQKAENEKLLKIHLDRGKGTENKQRLDISNLRYFTMMKPMSKYDVSKSISGNSIF